MTAAADKRQGGNYTRPVPYTTPAVYEALVAGKVVGRFDSHQEAEEELRRAFDDVPLIPITFFPPEP